MDRKDTFRFITTGIIAILLCTSCSKLPIVKSHWHEKAMDADNNFSNYDSKSGLRYMVSNDNTHLYVSFDTDNPGIKRNIMISGARISVDTNGKKKGTAYLKYPLMDRKQNQQNTNREGRPQGEHSNAASQMPGRRGNGERMPQKAVFVSGGTQYAFDNLIDKTDFKTILMQDSMGVMYYMVGIPFEQIHADGIDAIHHLVVGIEIEASSTSSQIRPPSGGGSMGGSGRPGGGRAGGSRTGGGQSRSQGSMSNASNPVKIWFETSLETNN